MDPLLTVGLGMVALFVLIALHFPIGIAMAIVGISGFALQIGAWEPAISLLGIETVGLLSNTDLAVIPLFLIMGSFATAGGLSRDIFNLINAFLGHRRGGLAIATIIGCALFGSICGLSPATAATFGRVALPEMQRYGYSGSLAGGSIAAGGTLGSIVPPSIVLVIYAVITEQFILDLFLAAVIPAILALVMYCALVWMTVAIKPELAPAADRVGWAERGRNFVGAWRVLLLFLSVTGGIYGGVFTITEAAALGAVMSFVFAALGGSMRMADFWEALADTAKNTAMVYVAALGALIFSYFVGSTQAASAMVAAITALELSPILVIVLLLGVYLILGCVFDTVAAMLITLPFVAPLVAGIGYDLVWWGIVMVVVIEVGLITPPIGLNVFVLHGVAPNLRLAEIFRGVAPFVAVDLLRLAILVAIPSLTLWLPQLMR